MTCMYNINIHIWLYKETPPLILEFTRTRAEPVARTRTPAEGLVERRWRTKDFQATANPCRDHLHTLEEPCPHDTWSAY